MPITPDQQVHATTKTDSESAARPRQSWQEWLTSAPVLLRITFLLTFLSYLHTVTFDWVFDDHYQVTLNPWLDSWGSLKQIFTLHSWAFSDFTMPAKFYRPMYLVWLLVNKQLFGGVPAWFHLAGVGLHLLVVYLAYLTARRLLGNERLAAVATLIFALHPTKVESVAWVAGLTEVVLAAFFFGTVLAYLRWTQTAGRPSKWIWISVTCFAGAIFSKETAVLAPILILSYEWLFAQPGRRSAKALAKLMTPYLLVGLFYFVVRMRILSGVAEFGGTLSVEKTLFTLPLAFGWYLKHTVWPFGLSLYYQELIVRGPEFLRFILPLLALIAASAAYLWMAKDSPLAKFLGLWFVLTLAAPVVTILLLQPHDRYLYLPSFTFAVLCAMLLGRFEPYARKAAPIVAIVAITFCAGTLDAAQYWENDLKLFSRALEKAPDNMAVRPLAAGALAENGQEAKALEILEDGFRRHPDSVNVSYALAQNLLNQGRTEEAKKYFNHTLAIAEDKRVKAMCHFQLGMMAQSADDLATAEAELRKAIDLTPNSAGFHQALGNVLNMTARPQEAQQEFAAEQDVRRTRTRNF